jgi:hypothetical protein
MGELKCSQPDQTQCGLKSVGKDPVTGDFTGSYSVPAVVAGKNRRLLESERRFLQATQSTAIKNPVVCMSQGSAMLFSNISPVNYPVYEKDSLINTNINFDFSKFLLLEQTLKAQNASSKNNVTQFVFTFNQAGVYVFSDSNNTAKVTIMSVMSPSQQCPTGTVYASLTQANLLKVGIALQSNVVYSPDWNFFIGAISAFLFLILMSIFVVGYIYRKSWKTKTARGEDIAYQKLHFSALKVEDPEDPDSLITINADAQSFYVLNQGKDMVRTREQQKQQRANKEHEAEARRKEKQQKREVLEIEQVEDLKDRLNKHMMEIRKLFGSSASMEGDDEGLLEEDPTVANAKLIDQILKLKLLINENRRALEGADDDAMAEAADEKEELER